MSRTNAIPGLVRRSNGIYHVDWVYRGQRHCFSTRTKSLRQAKEVYESHRAKVHAVRETGLRPQRLFEEAALLYLADKKDLRSIDDETALLGRLLPIIGDVPLDRLYWETVEPFIASLRHPSDGGRPRKNATLNRYIGAIRRVLTSATQRTNDNGTTWLQTVPYLPTFDEKKDALIRRPLSMEQQGRLFGALPEHLRRMAEFAVNTGCRDAAVCGLRWDQEVWVGELGASVFVVQNKGGGEMVVPLNASALAAVDACRGDDDEYVFTFRGNRVHRMVSTGWRVARKKSCVEATPHWLRHTFAARLRSAGVSVEDRAELMGHSNSNVTTHYSAADLRRLLQAVRLIDPDQQGRVCEPLIVVKGRR